MLVLIHEVDFSISTESHFELSKSPVCMCDGVCMVEGVYIAIPPPPTTQPNYHAMCDGLMIIINPRSSGDSVS